MYFAGGEKAEDEKWVAIGVLIFFIALLLLIIISTFKTGNENPGCLEKVTRYKIFVYWKTDSLLIFHTKKKISGMACICIKTNRDEIPFNLYGIRYFTIPK